MRLTPFNKSCCWNSPVWGGDFGVGTHSISVYGPVAAAATRTIKPVPTGFHAIDRYPDEQQAVCGLILPLLQGTYVSDVQRAGFLFTEKNPNNSNSATTSR
ncbi:hypothetical protein DPMN_162349 [Dreissena polymorpha]|uniref:Uncharacterized protein n=1 Tax=Dreissena polymorpha TaxID=45954 RepID=A0A9D4EUQ1_DREPO|nr:hypothetical protein DPMN_162349 [Dreissena polymorpha]